MARITIFLACLVLFVLSLGNGAEAQKSVAGVDDQCKKRGYFGACFDWLPEQNWITNPAKCRNLKCAERRKTRPPLVEVLTGPAFDGTICGDSKICRDGECVEVTKEEIPVNTGSGERWYCVYIGPHV